MKQPLIVAWSLAKVVAVWIFLGWCTLQVRKLDSYFPVEVPAWTMVPWCILLMLGGILVLTCGGILGAVMLMLGLGLYEHSISVLFLGLPVFIFLHLIVVYVEEPGLEKRFGASYLHYRQSVNRWLPGLGGNTA